MLTASYYFYMNWEPVYAVLIFGSTAITYLCGRLVEKYKDNHRRQKLFLVASLIVNFSILFIFKYYNFINETIFTALDYAGLRWPIPNFDILLPVGISFYTFQAVGYSIDVYRGDIKVEKNFGIYALFVSFFPQLVAGPIERAKNLLAQFYVKHTFNYDAAVAGLRLMLWGYFMKLCIADRVAMYVDAVYNNAGQHNGTTLSLATLFFTFQIYCDFGGYSLIAIGTAKIMGFNLMVNFRRPYFARSISDFWKRWHISLSSWFKDYVYIPLGGNRVSFGRHLFNLFLTFLISGVWHGANWTFVAWGGVHGAFLVIGVLKNKYLPNIKVNSIFQNGINIIVTFCLVAFAWIFFRANNVGDAFEVIRKIFTEHGGLFWDMPTFTLAFPALLLLLFKDFKDEFLLPVNFLSSKYYLIRYLSAIALVTIIILFGVLDGGQFIYFQF
ncbi:MAG: MBOAT family O-acyltransferase [Acinetobacter sp.]